MDNKKKTPPKVSNQTKKHEGRRHCFELNLNNTAHTKEEYQTHFDKVRPELIKSTHDFGINNLEIFFSGNCLIMILVCDNNFSSEKNQIRKTQAKVKDFVTSIWKNHLKLENDTECEDWLLMNLSYNLEK